MAGLSPAGRLVRAALLATLATLVLAGVVGRQALGHAQLVASSPGAGEVVAEPPGELILVFSEPLEDAFSGVDLTDATGALVLGRAGTVEPGDAHQLVVALPPLADGVYSVAWSSLSAADGHAASGFFSFAVGATDAPIPAGGLTSASTDESGALTAIGRWLAYLGLLVGIGLPLIATVVLRAPVGPRVVRLAGGLLVVSGLAAAGLALRAALAVEGGDSAAYLLSSRIGVLQVARAAVALAAGGLVLALAHHERLALAIASGAAAVGIGLLVAGGHASAATGVGALAAQWVHVAAVGVWLTGIATLLVLVTVRRGRGIRPLLPRFSALALAAIGLLGVSGSFAFWTQTGALPDAATDYGRIFLIKLVLALGALGLGALNYVDGGRGLRWLGGLRWRLSVEVALATAVLLATGLLATTPPAAASDGVEIAPVPDAFGRVVPGIALTLAPGRPGVNHVAVDPAGSLGNVALELVLDRLDGAGGQTRVRLRPLGEAHDAGSMPGMDHGPAGADGYVADAIVLPEGSRWDASVLVLVGDERREASRQRYAFAMDGRGVSHGAASGPIDFGVMVAVLLAASGALAVGLGFGGTRLPRCEAAASRVALIGGGAIAVALGATIGVGYVA